MDTLRVEERKRMLQKVESKYWSQTHKYGVRVAKSIKEAMEIDKRNGNTLWMDAVKLEMKNVRVAFEEYDRDPSMLIGNTQITGHIVIDVKLGETSGERHDIVQMGTRRRHQHPFTYSTVVVSRDSVRILLLIAALNGLDVLGADVQNRF